MSALKTFYKRTIYLFYYLKMIDWPKFWLFYNYVRKTRKCSGISLLLDATQCVYRYNIGLIDYFLFEFYDKDHMARSKWVGTGYKYEYDLIMNPVGERHILQNKIDFFAAFAPFIRHGMCTIKDLEDDTISAQEVLYNPTGKIAVKDALGQCGWDVEILRTADYTRESLLQYMKKKRFNLVEEFIVQHPALSHLSSTGLNTVRIITQISPEGGVDFIGPTLRVTVNSPVDNMAVGNIAAPIDLKTGKIKGKGAYSDITRPPVDTHPITGVYLIGYQIPYWNEVLDLCRNAALYNTRNKSIGWDVAITESGPSFVEGNHNWCKILWQLPAAEGLKHVLDYYLGASARITAVKGGRVTQEVS